MANNLSAIDTPVSNNLFRLLLKLLLHNDIPKINVNEALSDFNNYVFLDTRELTEFNTSHIQNARYTGYKDFNILNMKDIPKDQAIIVYCSVGKRSENILLKLKSAGYLDVKNLYGGIFEWVNMGNPVYDNNSNVTHNIHTYNHLWGTFLTSGEKMYN